MGSQVKRKPYPTISEELRVFSGYLDELSIERAASFYRGFSDEFAEGMTSDRLRDVCRVLLRSLRGGAGSLSDLYLTGPDGKPDDEATTSYHTIMNRIYNFAFRHISPTDRIRFRVKGILGRPQPWV